MKIDEFTHRFVSLFSLAKDHLIIVQTKIFSSFSAVSFVKVIIYLNIIDVNASRNDRASKEQSKTQTRSATSSINGMFFQSFHMQISCFEPSLNPLIFFRSFSFLLFSPFRTSRRDETRQIMSSVNDRTTAKERERDSAKHPHV